MIDFLTFETALLISLLVVIFLQFLLDRTEFFFGKFAHFLLAGTLLTFAYVFFHKLFLNLDVVMIGTFFGIVPRPDNNFLNWIILSYSLTGIQGTLNSDTMGMFTKPTNYLLTSTLALAVWILYFQWIFTP